MHRTKYGVPVQEFYPALLHTVQCALARYPETEDTVRMRRGMALIEDDKVTLHPDGTATVEGTGTYTVNGACTCRDFSYAPHGRCKHRWAKSLLGRTLEHVNTHRDPVWSTVHSVELRDGLAADGDLAATVCTPEFGHRHGGQHAQTAGK